MLWMRGLVALGVEVDAAGNAVWSEVRVDDVGVELVGGAGC